MTRKPIFFDDAIINGISRGDYYSIINIDQTLRRMAGECGFNSLMVGMGVVNKKVQHNEILSYEAPFGVGYLVGTL